MTTFELQTFSTNSKFNESFKRFVLECEFVEKYSFYDWLHRQRARSLRQPCFFLSDSTYHTNYSYWM